MKIGILTFHLGLNHGGFLQAYCLQNYLRKHGFEVQIINYKNKSHRYSQDIRPWFSKQKPSTWIRHFLKWRVFRKDQVKLSKTQFITDPEKLSSLHFDCVIIGSDIVWSQNLFGFDPVYFRGAPCEKLFSYAASFGWMPEDTKLPLEAIEGLKSFDSLMVRDSLTKKIVKLNTGLDSVMVLDPTLLDFSKPMTSADSESEAVLLVYAYSISESWLKAVTDYAKHQNLRIEMVGYNLKIRGAKYINVGPFDWISKFRTSRVIVTNTFHGSIYSVLSGHPFVSIWDSRSKDKISSFFAQIDCLDRLCVNPDTFPELLSEPLGQNSYKKLELLSHQSGDYLLSQLAS